MRGHAGAWLLGLCACTPTPEETPAPADAFDQLPVPLFEARVLPRIARLQQALPDLVESAVRAPEEGELDALVEMFQTAKGRMRDVPLEEMASFGDLALPHLRALSEDEDLDQETRTAALHMAFAIGSPASLEFVLSVLEASRDAWRRRYAAWLLGQSEDDRFLLRMILALRYEKDSETVIWLAEALARHGNYSGLDGLAAVASGGGPAAPLANAKLLEIVAALAPKVADLDALVELWASAECADVLDREPSPALRLAAWIELDELSSRRFQLRGVDDARFSLSRTGPWGARLVAEGLADEDPYVRLHGAQVLERMGARSRPVVDALHPLLRDPRCAHAVAEALGSIGAPSSLPLLLAALAPRRDHELRVAAAHGLGKFGSPAAGPRLRATLDDPSTPPDLALAVAAALARCTGDPAAIAWLVQGMGDPLGDPLGCEEALEDWIEQAVEEGDGAFVTLLDDWRELAGPPALLRTPQDTRDRLAGRAARVTSYLDLTAGEDLTSAGSPD